MMIYYSPQVSNSSVGYSFNNEKVIAEINGIVDEFDFSAMPDGELQLYSTKPPFEPLFETVLPIMPVIRAKRENGILYIELLKFISEGASEEEKFPEWVEV